MHVKLLQNIYIGNIARIDIQNVIFHKSFSYVINNTIRLIVCYVPY